MTADIFNAEQEALRSLVELLDQAKKCQMLYERAHMALPEPLKRVLGMNGVGGERSITSHIPPPERPPIPPDAEGDWIWIDAKAATPTTLALAILREAKVPVRAKDIVERVTDILPEASRGGIANLGNRLDEAGTIRRTDEGWLLLKPEAAGLLYKGNLWGPQTAFGKMELATHRRDAILHILQSSPSGLQIVQLVGELQRCPWVHAPVNKDLLKEDMEILQSKKKVRRRGHSKKWEIIPAHEKE